MSILTDTVPKIFISYAQANEEIRNGVIDLATALREKGINAILDLWDLKPGQDKFAFMEQCVKDDSMDYVLIICDKIYKDKADNRIGGVGDETVIITPEVYNDVRQEKFIPIVFERDDNGHEYLPIYLKSRIYIDLSTKNENYDDEFEKLLRIIHQKHLYKKPPIGKMPEYLNNENISYGDLNLLKKK